MFEAQTAAVLEVLGIAAGRRFHTGRMAVPGGVTYLVAAPPAGVGGVTAALTDLCARYDPPVVALVGDSLSDHVTLACGREPVAGAVGRFFAASGEPATLPGYGGAAPFQVSRAHADDEVPRYCADATTRRGKPLAWAVIRGAADRDAAQTLRYLIPYLRSRL